MESTRTFSDVACSICAGDLTTHTTAPLTIARSLTACATAPALPCAVTHDVASCSTSRVTDIASCFARQQARDSPATSTPAEVTTDVPDLAYNNETEHKACAVPHAATCSAVTTWTLAGSTQLSSGSQPQATAPCRLLDQLLHWRAARARSLGMGPAALIPIGVLQDVARMQPLNYLELASIMDGVPASRLALLGHDLLDVVKGWVYASQQARYQQPPIHQAERAVSGGMTTATRSSCETISHCTCPHDTSDCETRTCEQPLGVAPSCGQSTASFDVGAFFAADPQQEQHSDSVQSSIVHVSQHTASSIEHLTIDCTVQRCNGSCFQAAAHTAEPGEAVWEGHAAGSHGHASGTDGASAEATSSCANTTGKEGQADCTASLGSKQVAVVARASTRSVAFDVEAFFSMDTCLPPQPQQPAPQQPPAVSTGRPLHRASPPNKHVAREHSRSPRQSMVKCGSEGVSKPARKQVKQATSAAGMPGIAGTVCMQHPWGLDANELQLLLRQYSTSLAETSKYPSTGQQPGAVTPSPVNQAGARCAVRAEVGKMLTPPARDSAKFSVEEDVWIVQQAVACADLLETAKQLQRSTAAVKRRLRQHLLRPFPHARLTMADMDHGPVPLSMPSRKEGVPQGLPLHVRRMLYEALHTPVDSASVRSSRQQAHTNSTQSRAMSRRRTVGRHAGAHKPAAGRKRQQGQGSMHAPAAKRHAVQPVLPDKTNVGPVGTAAGSHVPEQPRHGLQLAKAASPDLEVCTTQQLRTLLMEAGMDELPLPSRVSPVVAEHGAVAVPQGACGSASERDTAGCQSLPQLQQQQGMQALRPAQPATVPASASSASVPKKSGSSDAVCLDDDSELHAQLLTLTSSALLRWEARRVLACKHLPPGVPRHEQVLRCSSSISRDPKEVRSAFRRLSLLLHPDKHLLHNTGAAASSSCPQQGDGPSPPAASSSGQDAELQAEAAEAFQMLREALDTLLAPSLTH